MSEKKDMRVHVSFGSPRNESVLFRSRVTNAATAAGVVLLFASAAFWIYLFCVENTAYQALRKDALIVVGLVFAGSLAKILWIGYDDRLARNIGITLAVFIVLELAAFYWSAVPILVRPADGEAAVLFYILEFLVYLLCAAVLAFVPVVLICFLMWVIMKIFGRAA